MLFRTWLIVICYLFIALIKTILIDKIEQGLHKKTYNSGGKKLKNSIKSELFFQQRDYIFLSKNSGPVSLNPGPQHMN